MPATPTGAFFNDVPTVNADAPSTTDPAASNPHGRVRWREHAFAALFIAALLVAVHYDVVFLGRSLVVTNHLNPLDYRFLPQNYGQHLVPPEVWLNRNLHVSANIRDAGGPWWQWEPDGRFLRQAMERGEWPFWDPYIAAGTPAMANMTPAYFFPPYTILVALGATVPLKNAYFLLLLWSAGFFTVLFLRRHHLAPVSALLGGTIVTMSGGLNQHIGTIVLQTTCCFPIVLYLTRRFLDRPGGRETLLLGLSYAAAALASFPPILMWVFGVTAIYTVMALALEYRDDPRRSRQVFLQWAATALLAMGLVSFFYVPALTMRAAAPYIVAFYESAGEQTMPAIKLLQLLSPTLAGGVHIYINSPVPTDTQPNLPYVGVVAIVAALLARTDGRRARLLFYGSAIPALLIALKLFGVPPVQWIAQVPLARQIHYAHYFGIPLDFLLAFLAALGLDALWRGSNRPRRAFLAVAVGLAGAESLWWYGLQWAVLESAFDRYWIQDWRVLTGLAVASAIVVLAGTLQARSRGWAAYVLVALVAAEGAYNNVYPSPRVWDIFDHPVPYVQALQRESEMTRVLPFGALSANVNSPFGIFSLNSLMTINPPRIYELYRRYTDPPPWLFLRDARRIPPEPVLDRAGIGLLAIREVFPGLIEEAQARGYGVRYRDDYVRIFERPAPPRFLFSSEYRVFRGADGVLGALSEGPAQEILLERTPGMPSTPNQPGDPTVRVETYRRNSFVLAVDAPRPGLVYAAESYFDGWSAKVNGVPSRILPANYAFRAVEVPAGPSRIEFRYWPPGLTAGLVVSGVSVVLLGGLCAAIRTRPPMSLGKRLTPSRAPDPAGAQESPSARNDRATGT
jgi:hypothetical protein